MTTKPRQVAPGLEATLTDGSVWRLKDAKIDKLQMLVFYRGQHCPICKTYLSELESRLPDFSKRGVGVVAMSMDSLARAQGSKLEWGLNQLLVGGEVSIGNAREWELFISGAIREGEPAEFSEPGLFLIAPDKTVFYASRTNAPWGRPSFDQILRGIDFVFERKSPARGEL
jgi:peroxiredoxin